ncbi:hypothetical protein GWI33_005481 [Rhynchophorus ferrugineus]|uniref:Uncharacterized protein n=1 Tax=Rhynchophorus ferrugineus TaxID=354439 RepID=A0A834IKF6_RHYFE|nr:hypothetical protein GWI33_005481 [Rhynchophorus ferrugineus]
MIFTILLMYIFYLNVSSSDIYTFTGDTCKSMPCPENTESCEKYLKTSSEQRTKLFVKIVCKNTQGNIIWMDNFIQNNIPPQHAYVNHIKNY